MQQYIGFSDKIKRSLRFESLPIAISFSIEPPEAVKQMKGEMRLCQMLDKVRFDSEIFYTTSDNHQCDGGSGSCAGPFPYRRSCLQLWRPRCKKLHEDQGR